METQVLPASKGNPKKIATVVDEPVIEEAFAADFENTILTTCESRKPIEDHSSPNQEIEYMLARSGKSSIFDSVKDILPPDVKILAVFQNPPGLGHVVLCGVPKTRSGWRQPASPATRSTSSSLVPPKMPC